MEIRVSDKVLIILPTLNRPARLLKSLESLRESFTNWQDSIRIVIVVDRDDENTIHIIPKLGEACIVFSDPLSSAVEKWNLGSTFSISNDEWLFAASDDVLYPLGWLDTVLITPNSGFIAIPDQHSDPVKWYEPFFIARREWLINNNGGVLAIPSYKHWGFDVETCERATKIGHFIRAKVNLTHNHWCFGTALKDSTYVKAEYWHSIDLQHLSLRRSSGYPNDFEPILKWL